MGERSSRSAPRAGWSPDSSKPLLVSACLLGVACNHQGHASTSPAVLALGRDRRLIPVCPESVGGLPTPRPAADTHPGGGVPPPAGQDVTAPSPRAPRHTVALAL